MTLIRHISVGCPAMRLEHGRMLAQGVLALSLAVQLYDAYGLPSDRLARARATTEAIMNAAGVTVTWPQCPCRSPIRSGALVVRVARASAASTPGSLGFSFVDLGLKAGTLATVFADRVQAMAAVAGVDEGELLGRVIAHEISHLLLGTRDHGSRGLMRGLWSADEVARQHPSDWRLSSIEAIKIRQAIRRKSAESPPAMMAVDADAAPDATTQ